MATYACQYCGADLETQPPLAETGWLYGVECSRCPPERRRSMVLARRERVAELRCPNCGVTIDNPEGHPDVLVVKEMTYDVCAVCGERCGVGGVRKIRDVSGGTM